METREAAEKLENAVMYLAIIEGMFADFGFKNLEGTLHLITKDINDVKKWILKSGEPVLEEIK